jgi:hypothetical protein
VPSTKFRKQIGLIQKLFETKASISFCGDSPKKDQINQRALVEELKHRKTNGEADLIICKGAIIKKKLLIAAIPPTFKCPTNVCASFYRVCLKSKRTHFLSLQLYFGAFAC